MTAPAASSFTIQNVFDKIVIIGDVEPCLNAGGYSAYPMLPIANDVMDAFLTTSVPWKWNEFNIPVFYTNSWQQDYAVPGLTTLSWLQGGTIIDINNQSLPKPYGVVQAVRDQRMATASYLSGGNLQTRRIFNINWLPNNLLYFGTWGAANTGNATLGNNPVANSVYTQPLAAGLSQPYNPITQIVDANGNYLVLTTYGHEGSAAPVAASGAAAGTTCSGTGATTVWTVVSPYGQGFRLYPMPSQTGVVWQFNLVGQSLPVQYTSMAQSLAPLPDDYEPHFRKGCVANAYQYSPEAKVAVKFAGQWKLWTQSLVEARQKTDRERDGYKFVPARTIMGTGGGGLAGVGNFGPDWPFNYPRT